MIEIEEIKTLIPHRYPFLLVDRVLSIEENIIETIKNLTVNEEFFNGHFPGAPMMPGVLQMEALAQSGLILMMKKKVEDPEKSLIVFSTIKNAKFRKPVTPGDQLNMNVELVGQRRNFVNMVGKATVDGKIACEMEAMAAITNKDQ